MLDVRGQDDEGVYLCRGSNQHVREAGVFAHGIRRVFECAGGAGYLGVYDKDTLSKRRDETIKPGCQTVGSSRAACPPKLDRATLDFGYRGQRERKASPLRLAPASRRPTPQP